MLMPAVLHVVTESKIHCTSVVTIVYHRQGKLYVNRLRPSNVMSMGSVVHYCG